MNQQRRRKQRLSISLAVALGGALVFAFWALPLESQDKDPDFQPQRVVDRFPPITEFPVKPVREAAGALNSSELVIGVTVGKEARAYPINMMTGPQREILNDTLGGKVIAATW